MPYPPQSGYGSTALSASLTAPPVLLALSPSPSARAGQQQTAVKPYRLQNVVGVGRSVQRPPGGIRCCAGLQAARNRVGREVPPARGPAEVLREVLAVVVVVQLRAGAAPQKWVAGLQERVLRSSSQPGR